MIFQISKYKISLHSIQFQAPPCQFAHNSTLIIVKECDANATGLSVPCVITWDNTDPRPPGDASHANRTGKLGS